MNVKTPKLPLWATVKGAYSVSWNNRSQYIKIARNWLCILLPITLLYNWFVWDDIKNSVCMEMAVANAGNNELLVHNMLLLMPPSLFSLFAGASIAVAWHRLVLRGEQVVSNTYLRTDNVVWGYFCFGLILMIVVIAPSFFTVTSYGILNDRSGLAIRSVLIIVLSIVTLLVSQRLAIMLPAKALAKENISVKEVWKKTSGNFWRIFIGMMLCLLPWSVLGFFLRSNCNDGVAGAALYTLNTALYILLMMPISLSFLSLAYQHFFEKLQLE